MWKIHHHDPTHLVDKYSVHILRLSKRVLNIVIILLTHLHSVHFPHGLGHVKRHIVASFPHVPAHAIVLDAVRVRDVAPDPNGLGVGIFSARIRQYPPNRVPVALERGRHVGRVREEAGLGQGGPQVVVARPLVRHQDDGRALANVEVYAPRADGFNLDAVELDDRERVVVDAEPVAQERGAIDYS